jgi:hypothetical protein
LAADFATRSADHDRDTTRPTENYARLREEGFYELNIPKEWGGSGVGLLGHTPKRARRDWPPNGIGDYRSKFQRLLEASTQGRFALPLR